MAQSTATQPAEVLLKGMGVSPGVAVGPVCLVTADEEAVSSHLLEPGRIDQEIDRFHAAIDTARAQIHAIQKEVKEHVGIQDARILEVHLMVLDDNIFIDEIRSEIKDRRHNVEHAVWMVSDRYAQVLANLDDEYLRERAADVKDVARRLLRFLGGRLSSSFDVLPDGILVGQNLSPSDAALLRRDRVGGFVTDLGSPVSHTAIMARALAIPAVVALGDVTSRVSPGDNMLIDGNRGLVVIRPTAERLKTYGDLMDRRNRLRFDIAGRVRGKSTATADDVPVALYANVDDLDGLDEVLKYGGDGIGLFRSESMLLGDGTYASEQQQASVYRALAERMYPRPVVIRTLDLGGEKNLPENFVLREDNPSLGCRGIRLCLAESESFKIQLRAIVSAASAGNLKIMYPMVSDISELLRANELLRDICEQNSASGENKVTPAIGVMIETPAAALCADAIAPYVTFMSIGSNDLIQYAMAADRGNYRVSYLYQPTHPAILRLIKTTVEAAGAAGVPVGICGEMAGDPVLTPLLVGLGVSDLSMVASSIPPVKAVLRAVRMTEARDLAFTAVRSRSGPEVLEHCRAWLRERVPDVYELIG